jgi:hypothetical protein
MEILISSAVVAGARAAKISRQPNGSELDETQITLLEVPLSANSVLTVSELVPGQCVRVRMVQDAVGGWTAAWAGATFEGLPAALVPDPLPGSVTDVFCIVRSASVVEVSALGGSSTPGSGGLFFVANWAALLALNATTFPTGTIAFVETLKRQFVLDRDGVSPLDPYVVGAALGGGQWFTSTPDPFWVQQTDFFVNDAASSENSGLAIGAPIPFAEWSRRISQLWPPDGLDMIVHVLADFGVGQVGFDCSRFNASGSSTCTFRGGLKSTVLAGGVVAAVSTASPLPAVVGGTDGTIGIVAPSFAASVGKLGRINAGPRAGATFWILADLGIVGGLQTARIGNVGATPDTIASVTLLPGDTFDVWNLITCLVPYFQAGGTLLSAVQAVEIDFSLGVQVAGGSELFAWSCSAESELSAYGGATIGWLNCWAPDAFTFTGSTIYLQGGGGRSDVFADGTPIVILDKWTGQGSQLTSGGIAGGASVFSISANSWLASFDSVRPSVLLPPGTVFRGEVGSTHWGQNVSPGALGRINLQPGAVYVYANLPNIQGASARDVVIATQPLSFPMLPAAHVDTGTGCFALANVDRLLFQTQGLGSFLAVTGALRSKPAVIVPLALGGPQSVALTTGAAFEINAGIVAPQQITWTEVPSSDAILHGQSWTLRYPGAGTGSVTFPNTFISARDLAGILAAEALGAVLVLSFYWGTDGRAYLSSWSSSVEAVPFDGATFIDRTGASPVLTASVGVIVNVCDGTVVTPTLPAISASNDGFAVNVDAGAALVISPAGLDTIDGAASYSLTGAGKKVVLLARNSTKRWLAYPGA